MWRRCPLGPFFVPFEKLGDSPRVSCHGLGAGLTLAGVAWSCEPCEHLAQFTSWTRLVSCDPQGRGFFLIGQVALQQRFEFVDALVAPAFIDDGHADGHEVDRLRIRALAAGSATAGC